jgi:hypothetical protein
MGYYLLPPSKSATKTNGLAACMVIGRNYSLTTHVVLTQDGVDWLAALGHHVAEVRNPHPVFYLPRSVH